MRRGRRNPSSETRVPCKTVNGYRYILRGLVPQESDEVRSVVKMAEGIVGWEFHAKANVVKVPVDGSLAVTFLWYEDLRSIEFPALMESVKVDINTGAISRRRYWDSGNPPILHRKELLLPQDEWVRFKAEKLTAELEERGLFQDAGQIGHRRAWEERLARAGVEVREHEIVDVGDSVSVG